jgi:hypothetical protein
MEFYKRVRLHRHVHTVLPLTLAHLYHVHSGRMLLQHGRQQVLDH